jgi:hypothetical protein
MKLVAIFAVMLGVGLLVAPGVAQSTGLGASVAEDLDPVGHADAHVEDDCDGTNPCFCYYDSSGEYHCHG